MRPFRLTTLIALLAIAVGAPTALALTQVNVYTVSGSYTSSKGATKAKPKPVGVSFDYKTTEQSGLRPSPVKAYSIQFGGLRANNTAFAGCNFDKLNDPNHHGPKTQCPKGSVIGHGEIFNDVGGSEDPTTSPLKCYLALTLVNADKRNHISLWLEGDPSVRPPKHSCVTDINQAIDARLVQNSAGTAIVFNVAPNLLHPGGVGVFDNAITHVDATLGRLTKTVKAKGKKRTVGFFESTGCSKKTNLTVTFTQESDGSSTTKSAPMTCG